METTSEGGDLRYTRCLPQDLIQEEGPEELEKPKSIRDKYQALEARKVPKQFGEYIKKLGGLAWPVLYFKNPGGQTIQIETSPEEKIHIMGAGVNPNEFTDADGERFKEKYDLSDSQLILFMGNRISSKGIFTLIESMRYVKRSYPDSRLVLVGRSGREYDEYYSNLPPELKSIIVDVGVLPKQEKADAFSAADIFVMPSKFESIGLVYLEAWHKKKPVIGAEIPAIKELILKNKGGMLVRFNHNKALASAIKRLINNSRLAKKFAENGYQALKEKYTLDAVFSQYQKLFID